MRQLTQRQKRLLDVWVAEHKNLVHIGFTVDKCPEIHELYEQLQKINDTEILWQEVNRYVSDQSLKLGGSYDKLTDTTTKPR